MVPGPATSALLGNILEIKDFQMLDYTRFTELEVLGPIICLMSPPVILMQVTV